MAIKHADDLYTVYEFLNPVCKGGKAFVKVGDTVKAGQCIGLAGFSGMAPENGVGYACFTELPELFSKGCDPDYISKDTWTDAHEEKYTPMVIPDEYDGYAGVITDADGNVVELVEVNPAWQG